MLMTWNVFSNTKFNFKCIEALLYKSEINNYGVYVVNKETRKEQICTFLRRGDVLLLTHTSKVANQKIQILQTVIML